MAIKLQKVNISDLQVGMYVSGLDRPWTQTPFPLQGFHIKSASDIEELARFCKWVQIDAHLSRSATDKLQVATTELGVRATPAAAQANKTRPIPKGAIRIAPLKIDKRKYVERTPLKHEAYTADQTYNQLRPAIKRVMTSILRGQSPNIDEALNLSNSMVDSIVRNPDAFSWISRIRKHDEHTFDHSIRATIWAVIFGRHIGLEKDDLYSLAQATLLKDIGTLKINKQILRASPRTEEQQTIYQTHVLHCVQLLEDNAAVSPTVIDIIQNHCERIDGSGYPRGLVGDKIPSLSKIVGIVTTYDGITNPRDAAVPLTPSSAISSLYTQRNRAFQEELVVEFIQAVGIYPTGTLVELNSGEVGVVVEQSPKRRLRPVVMLVTDNEKNPLRKPKPLDLFKTAQAQNGLPIEITRDLEAEAFGINPNLVREQYLSPSKSNVGRFFDRLLGNA